MKKYFIILLVIFLISFVVFAQSITEIQNNSLTFTDSYNNTISLDNYPKRIVSLTPNITETIYALDSGEKLVGRNNYDNYPVECLTIPSVGDLTNPSIEQIVALKPDLIICGSIVSEATVNSLKDLGFKVVVLNKESSLNGSYELIKDMGILLNENDKANQLINNMKTKIMEIDNKISNEEKVTCYYCVSFGDWGDYGATGDTFINDIIEKAGGINIASSASSWSVSREVLISKDPQIVILPSYSYTDFQSSKTKFKTTLPYSQLTVSKTDGIYTVDGDIFDRQGPRNSEAIEALAKILHPNCFK